ncbi:MAG: flagellar hook-basal body complex protein [Pseudomonadales bacterium]|nr:flagellar hook-basal body complex protein [Pseudomonadales bacterium]
MMGSIYKGLAGMLSFSEGLSGISSNVGNLNTTAYKKNDNSFTALVSHNGKQNDGVQTSGSQLILSQGDLKNTGNDTDIAIEGNGFFVVEKNGEYLITRDGQFRFNDEGFLVARDDEIFVMANVNGSLQRIEINNYVDDDYVATTQVDFRGNLNLREQFYDIEDVVVVDSTGARRDLIIKINTNSSVNAGEWNVEIFEGNDILLESTIIKYNKFGYPEEGFNELFLELEAENGDVNEVVFSFGKSDNTTRTTSNSGETSIEFDKHDGREHGYISNKHINEYGQFVYEYSNGNKKNGSNLAIASITSPEHLIAFENNMFKLDNDFDLVLIDPRAMGTMIQGGKLELSNVELSQEFSEMIIVQRGYQASSQVMTTANEMLQQLLEATKG